MEAKKKDPHGVKKPMSIRISDDLRYRLKMRAATDRRTCVEIMEELLTTYLADPKPTAGVQP